MSVSRFFGATTREALRQVRLALGPEALIVSNRRVSGGVEILATDATAVAHAEATARAPSSTLPVPPAADDPVEPAARHVDLQQAVGDLRGMLDARLDELMWGGLVQRSPVVLAVFQRLLGLGFSTNLLRAMLKHLPGKLSERAALEWCRDELVKHLPVAATDEKILSVGSVLALVGPTGVGKTTTVAKLAARCVKRVGAGNVVLLTTDTYRIGAHEQLRIYGRLMGVPVHVAENTEQLIMRVREAGPEKLVLIDNIGVSQRDAYVAEQAAMLAAASPRVVRLLALNAASHGDTLDEVVRRYVNDGGPRLAGCLITKVDEAGRLGPVLDTVLRYRLPVHYVSTGQKVPEDLLQADATLLVDQALGAVGATALYTPSQADLAALMAAHESAAAQTKQDTDALHLESVLALMGGATGRVSRDDLRHASRYIDAHLATAAAYEALNAKPDFTAGKNLLGLANAERTLGLLGDREVLVLANNLRLSDGQSIRTALLATPDGQWLTAPWQCWRRADGWHDSAGRSGAGGLSTAQLDELMQSYLLQAGQMPQVSILDDSAASRPDEQSWMAVCTPRSKWLYQGEPSLAIAISRQIVHEPLTLKGVVVNDDALPKGVSGDDVTWWVAQTEVSSNRRDWRGRTLQFHSLRAVHRDGAAVARQWLAISNLQASQQTPEAWSGWLLQHAMRRRVSTLAQAHWQWLSQRPGHVPSVQQGGLAVQLALATLHMQTDPAVWRLLCELAESATPSASRLAQATWKLFELKRMWLGQAET